MRWNPEMGALARQALQVRGPSRSAIAWDPIAVSRTRGGYSTEQSAFRKPFAKRTGGTMGKRQ